MFAAVMNSGTGTRVMSSADGVVWRLGFSALDANWASICWSPFLNQFVAVANASVGNCPIMTGVRP
jgi:hypothetical protein